MASKGAPKRAEEHLDEYDRHDAFGGLSAAADKNATFLIHSKPIYKLEANARAALTRAHIPRRAWFISGEISPCTDFVQGALDMVTAEFGDNDDPSDAFDPDPASRAMAAATGANLHKYLE